MKYLLVLLFSAAPAFAEDNAEWFCKDQTATRSGDVFMVCGIGESMEQGYARKRAMAFAIDQFDTICDQSSDCQGRPRSMEPKRTTCSRDPGGIWRCFQLVQYTLGK